jgi:hypothetical protein
MVLQSINSDHWAFHEVDNGTSLLSLIALVDQSIGKVKEKKPKGKKNVEVSFLCLEMYIS